MPRKPIQKDSLNDQHWSIVQSGINDILSCKQSQLLLSELHDSVTSLLAKDCRLLSDGLHKSIVEHFGKWKKQLSQGSGVLLLNLFSNIYSDFMNYCKIIPKVYMQFDLKATRKEERSKYVLKSCFYQIILSDNKLISNTVHGIRKDMNSVRQGTNVNLQKLFNLVDMFYKFKKETNLFSNLMKNLKQDTMRYYKDFFMKRYNENNFLSFLKNANEQFVLEEKTINAIFDKKVEIIDEILKLCIQTLLVDNISKCLSDKAISSIFISGEVEPMIWLTNVFTRYSFGLNEIYDCCAIYIKNEMLKLSKNFKEQNKGAVISRSVGELIDLTKNLYNLYERIFHNNKNAILAIENQIKKAWNDPCFNITENFCIYIDQNIRNEMKNLSDSEKEDFAKTIALFYRRTEDKKMFSEIYNSNMIVRFTKMKEKLIPIETPIIQAIRRENSPDFAKIFRDFIKKINSSHELLNNFLMNKGKISKIQFSPLLFEKRGFPVEIKEASSDISPKLLEIHNAFQNYYTDLKPTIRLIMLSNLSTVDAQLIIPKNQRANQRTYTLTSDVYCASILDIISQGEIKFQDLSLIFKDKTLLSLYLKRLCSSTMPILKRIAFIPNDKVLNDNDIFQINPNFVHNSSKITIQSITNEYKKNLESVTKKVEFSKKQSIKACVIRFLKKTRRIEQSILEQNVIVDLSQYFHANLSLIRSAMEELEEDMYFKREKAGEKEYLIFLDSGY